MRGAVLITLVLVLCCDAFASDIDSIVVVSARDSVHFNVKRKVMRLRGKAVVTYKTQKIEAEQIEMDFGTSTMSADGATDSSGNVAGFPVFNDMGEEFAGESMTYNFVTGKGRVKFGETNVEGGYYYGSRIKRVGEKTAYVQDGCFTTCDAPHPHFFFNSPEMKIVMDDKIYLDPVIWYVEDIPVFGLPFGMFFSIERGRRSGIIMPSPLITSDRGIVLQNLGYYFAVSDYFDTELTADLTTKGGFTVYSNSQYSVRDKLTGRARLTFGYTRFNVEDPYTMNMGINLNHQQQLRPSESISMDLEFTTQKLYQNTSLVPIDRVRQNARSNASYQRTFYNGMTFNANYTRDQNMINGSVTEVPALSFGIPQSYPLRNVVSGDHWLRDMTAVYRMSGRYYNSKQRPDDTSTFALDEYSVIEHRPGVTVTPKLGNFTFAPSATYSENWYFQQYSQTVNMADSTINSSRESGFFREYTYSVGVSASTFLYGMAYPHAFGVSAFRHTLQPVIGFSYRPDQSDTSLGFFGQYQSPVTGNTITYRKFGSAGSLASQQEQLLLTIGVLNKFSIKPEQDSADTVGPKPIDVLTLNLNTSYNFVADSNRLTPITFNLRSPMLDAIQFNLSGTFNPYDQALVADAATGRVTWRDIGATMIESGKGLGRFTNISMQMGTSFSSEGVSFNQSSIVQDTSEAEEDGDDLRSRFGRRLNIRESDVDLFADHTPGWSPVIMPWNVNLNLAYTYSRPNPDVSTQSLLLSFRGALTLTQTLSMSAVGSFNLIDFQLNSPIIDITKRIHCWNLTLNWVPLGVNQGFFLRFSAAAPQLQGLVFPKQSTPLYR